MKAHTHILAALLAAAVLSGCITAEQRRAERIANNPQIFGQLSEEARARASAGTFAIGDPAATVWFALGEPASRSATTTAEGTYETWLYTRLVSEPYEVLVLDRPPPPPPGPYGRRGPPPPPPPFPHYETRYRTVQVPAMQIVMSGGLVAQVTSY